MSDRTFFFFVDSDRYEYGSSTITGAEVKQVLGNFDPSYSLFVEGHGGEPDKLVADSDSFSLELPKHGPVKFYTVPPASFGTSVDP
jgi:hypothetical protein